MSNSNPSRATFRVDKQRATDWLTLNRPSSLNFNESDDSV